MGAAPAVGLLGQCELVLEKYRDAAEHLAYAIRNTPDGKAANTIPGLKEELADAKTKIATLRITVDQSDAEVTIGDRLLGKSPINEEVFAEPGRFTIKATHPTHGKSESTLDVKAGEERAVALKLEQAPNTGTPPTVAAATLRSPSELDKPSKLTVNPPPLMEKHDGVEARTIVLIAGTAVTVLGAGVGTVFALKGKNAKDDARELLNEQRQRSDSFACPGISDSDGAACSAILRHLDDRNEFNRVGNWAFAAAGVVAVGTIAVLLSWPAKTRETAAVLTPIVARGLGGINLTGSF